MKKTGILLTLLLLITIGAMAQTNHILLNIMDFSDLKVADGINVIYKSSSDSAGMAVFEASPEMTSAVTFSNRSGKLEMRLNDNIPLTGVVPTVTLYSSFLTRVENDGDSAVSVLSLAKAPAFTAVLQGNGRLLVRDLNVQTAEGFLKTGNGTLVMRGVCNLANIKFMGSGVIQADDLKAIDVSVSASGTGQVGVWAQKLLRIKGMGSTTIYYKGTPEIKKSVAIGLKIKPLQ